MAVFQGNIFSSSLLRSVPITVILPSDKPSFDKKSNSNKQMKSLYLLHGILGDNNDWLFNTNIKELAEKYNLAVIMPAGENHFYVDHKSTHDMYGEFIGQELIDTTRKMFNLSSKRTDTFICGLSMGGYGALRNGLKYYQNFGVIGALSSALIIYDLDKRTNSSKIPFETKSYAQSIFGKDLAKVKDSDYDPVALAKKIVDDKQKISLAPKIYMACGTEDSLFEIDQKVAFSLKKAGLNVEFESGHGKHEWKFWSEYIKHFIRFLDLSQNTKKLDPSDVKAY